jgi:hypothetical protein
MTTPEIIQQLVKRFEEHKEIYRSGRYNETQLRREFESTDRAIDRLVYELYELYGLSE